MSSEATDYGRVALEFVDALDSLKTRKGILAAVDKALSNFGFEHYVIADLPPAFRNDMPTALAMKGPIGWYDFYFENRLYLSDPVVQFCRGETRPFEWREMPPIAQPRSLEVMLRAQDFGLAHGMTLPIRNLNGRTSVFSMSSASAPFVNQFTKPAIHLMMIYASESLRKTRPDAPAEKVLTPREVEVLTWAAAGKSASTIADLLGITERTVVAHTINATQKLGANNKTQAVAIALHTRLIAL